MNNMPQMMPLNWLLLMIFFILIYYLMMIYLYFFFIYKKKSHLSPILNTIKFKIKW